MYLDIPQRRIYIGTMGLPEIETIPTKEVDKQGRKKRKKRPIKLPQYHVILLDDDEHSYEYVIEMLTQLFRHSRTTAFEMACLVDLRGQVIVDTTTRERAELKRDQIHAFGADWRIPHCKGSMSARIEPVAGGD